MWKMGSKNYIQLKKRKNLLSLKGIFITIKRPKDGLLNTHGSEILKIYQITKRRFC